MKSLNHDAARARIVGWTKGIYDTSGAKGLLIGLSGGVDSALTAYLCVEAVGPKNVHALVLPSETTPTIDTDDAVRIAKALKIGHEVLAITRVWEQFVVQLGGADFKDFRALGNLKARIRMAALYLYANRFGYLVAGTDDKSEGILGFYTKWGDGGVDFNPIGDMYKTEVRQMARLVGVPESVMSKPSSPRLWAGQTAEGELGLSYDEIDRQLMEDDFRDLDERIRTTIERNKHKAGEPPRCAVEDLRV